MGNFSRRHHFVPKFHLGGFVDSDQRVWVLDQKSLKQWPASLKDVACESNLYSVELEGHPPDVIEKAFADVESMAAPLLHRLTEDMKPPRPDDITVLANYLALLAVRVPAKRKLIEKFIDQTYRMTARLMVAGEDRWKSIVDGARASGAKVPDHKYEDVQKFVEGDAYLVRVPQNLHVGLLLEQLDSMIQMLAARKWSVCVIERPDMEFICSDNPVSLEWIPARRRFWPPGFGLPETEVAVPISAKLALIGPFEGSQGLIQGNRHNVARINSRTGRCASRFLYSNSPNILWLMKGDRFGDTKDLLKAIQRSRKDKK